MNNLSENTNILPEMEVAHIVLVEDRTGKVLIQHNKKFDKKSFIGGKCDGKSFEETIREEMSQEIGYSLISGNFYEVEENNAIVDGKLCNGKTFVGYLPKGFESKPQTGEGESKFYNINNLPISKEEFITGKPQEITMSTIKKALDILYTNED